MENKKTNEPYGYNDWLSGDCKLMLSNEQVDNCLIFKQSKELIQLREENKRLADEKLKQFESWHNTKIKNNKLQEQLKQIRSQLFDANNCETILTKSIDNLLTNKG